MISLVCSLACGILIFLAVGWFTFMGGLAAGEARFLAGFAPGMTREQCTRTNGQPDFAFDRGQEVVVPGFPVKKDAAADGEVWFYRDSQVGVLLVFDEQGTCIQLQVVVT